jgi:hypothetical protein
MLGWVGLGWVGLGCVGLGWVGSFGKKNPKPFSKRTCLPHSGPQCIWNRHCRSLSYRNTCWQDTVDWDDSNIFSWSA